MSKNNKKKNQLGIHPSTANGRLIKDILFNFIIETNKDICFYCGKKLTRETFSIEHKVPWLDSTNPKNLYFDLNNISYSHLSCNAKNAKRVRPKIYNSKSERIKAGTQRRQQRRNAMPRKIYKELRHDEYRKFKAKHSKMVSS